MKLWCIPILVIGLVLIWTQPAQVQAPSFSGYQETITWPWPKDVSAQAKLIAFDRSGDLGANERFVFQEPDGVVKYVVVGSVNSRVQTMRTFIMAPPR